MDNLAHTLVGAALGRAVADRKVPAAGWIGAIAGNAPDWSELLVSPGTWGGAPGSAPAYLVYHRGITHSFVGAGAPRTPGHEWGHDARALDGEVDRRGVGAPRRDGTHGGVRGRLDEALVRRRRAAACRGLRPPAARGLRGAPGGGQRGGEGAGP